MKSLQRFLTPEVLKWVGAGIVFTAVSLGLLKLFAGVLGWPYTLSTVCAGEVSNLLRFFAVDSWVFGHRKPSVRRLWQYHVANAVSFLVWWGAANSLKAAGVQYLLASVLATVCSAGFSMLSHFLWVWRKPTPAGPLPAAEQAAAEEAPL